MPVRVEITKVTYMPIGGQWQVVYPGTIVDLPDGHGYSRDNTSVLAETPTAVVKPTAVRNLRTAK